MVFIPSAGDAQEIAETERVHLDKARDIHPPDLRPKATSYVRKMTVPSVFLFIFLTQVPPVGQGSDPV